MDLTRRHFVGIAGATLTAGLVTGRVLGQQAVANGLFPIPVESMNDPLNYLQMEHFVPFAGTTFRAVKGDEVVNLDLLSVDRGPKASRTTRAGRGAAFSLLFRSLPGLSGGIYSFDHATLGRFSMFVSPVGLAGTKYEAVVNRNSQ